MLLTRPKAVNQLTANHRKLSILKEENRKNDNANKACDKRINFIRGQIRKNNLKGRSFFSETL